MSGVRERANAVIKYEPYIRPPGSLRRDLEARESWREMWERVCEGDARSKWSEGRDIGAGVSVKVVDRNWLEWYPGRSDGEQGSGGMEEEEEEERKGTDDGAGDESERGERTSLSKGSKGESTDPHLRAKDGSSELHDFGRLEEYLSDRFDQVFPE
jgi:hypothetical protein